MERYFRTQESEPACPGEGDVPTWRPNDPERDDDVRTAVAAMSMEIPGLATIKRRLAKSIA
jgi:hypothetical protein